MAEATPSVGGMLTRSKARAAATSAAAGAEAAAATDSADAAPADACPDAAAADTAVDATAAAGGADARLDQGAGTTRQTGAPQDDAGAEAIASPRSPGQDQGPAQDRQPAATNGPATRHRRRRSAKATAPSLSSRYSVPRHEGPRYASGPPGKPFLFLAKPRTVAGIWQEYKVGSNGNPALEALEREHGTGWRRGDLRERKYASNYVGNRRSVVEYVERLARERGWSVEEAIGRLDGHVDGRISALTDALRRARDPFVALPARPVLGAAT